MHRAEFDHPEHRVLLTPKTWSPTNRARELFSLNETGRMEGISRPKYEVICRIRELD
jgi:hypothetical protein